MKKVFVVTQGEYSGYHLEGIFSIREKAQAFIDELKKIDNYANIEEFILDKRQRAIACKKWLAYVRQFDGKLTWCREYLCW